MYRPTVLWCRSRAAFALVAELLYLTRAWTSLPPASARASTPFPDMAMRQRYLLYRRWRTQRLCNGESYLEVVLFFASKEGPDASWTPALPVQSGPIFSGLLVRHCVLSLGRTGVSKGEAAQAVRRAQEFVRAVQAPVLPPGDAI
jgi:hypothetical protein